MQEEQFKRGTQLVFSGQDFIGQTGSIGVLLSRSDYGLADLFASPVGIAEGSTVWVEELLRIIVSLDDESLVDLDTRWFGGKPYLGTYRVLQSEYLDDGSFDTTKEGFLNALDTLLTFRTPYLVVSGIQGRAMEDSTVVLDPCDFRLNSFLISNPVPPIVSAADSPTILGTSQAFVGRASQSYYSLGVGQLKDAAIGVGLYLNKGVSLQQVRKTTRIAGQVQTTRPLAIPPSACTVQTPNCGTLTSGFFGGGGERFRSFGEAVDFYVARAQTDAGLPELLASIVPIEVELAPGCKITYYTQGGLIG